MAGLMGSDPTPIEIRPRFGQSRAENVILVTNQLYKAGVPHAKVEEVMREYERLSKNPTDSETHPLSQALQSHGFKVHWV